MGKNLHTLEAGLDLPLGMCRDYEQGCIKRWFDCMQQAG
jgi:hypothetical protein